MAARSWSAYWDLELAPPEPTSRHASRPDNQPMRQPLRPNLETDARSLALSVLRRVATQGAFASSALRAAFDRHAELKPADRALATELVYGILRRRAALDRAIRFATGKRVKDVDPKLQDVLRIGAYQLMFLDRVPDHAAVSTAVDLGRARRQDRGARFVNAALRKLAQPPFRDPPPPPQDDDPVAHIAHAGGVPPAIARLLLEALGPEEATRFAVASLSPAPLTLRANLLRTRAGDLARAVGGTAGNLPESVRLPENAGQLPAELPCVRRGEATPQDEASMRVVHLLDPQPGERILDVCAAPGGKTTHIAERMADDGEVIAHDRHPARLRRVARAVERLGLSSVRSVELLPPPGARPFDGVLVDAPCSGLGTLRRHPEIRWRFHPDDLLTLTRTQARVLADGAAHVRPGGRLVYAVCTFTQAEGEAHLAALASTFVVEELLRTGPHQPGAPDGFFAARLRRR